MGNLQQIKGTIIEGLQSEIKDLEESNSFVTSGLQSQLQEKDTHIKLMMEKIDQLEQGTKANNIKIAGISEEEGEDIRSKVVDLVRDQLKFPTIKMEDIKDVGRMGKKYETKTRDVFVKFCSSTFRDTIYKKRKLLMSRDHPIYINEDLTQYRSQLFFEARKLRKRGKLFGVWTQNGNVMAKVNEDDVPCRVSDFNHLRVMIQDFSDNESDQDDSL